ncbi:hypothetical protein FBU59_000455 [Linderina macrospora]|uniref:Uncharacterized protein n=1 Tax=Linderina macrospora TaxID=4868 RepID=A0ACC1JGT6_9FUNG|nr:hypothetical protein FBU59_000455 [Linderina macrospora]
MEDDGHDEQESDSGSQARVSTESMRREEAREARRRRAKRRGASEVLSHGVDKVLAMMGSRTDVSTMNDRLQMHRDIPYVISGYLQLGVNTVVILFILYLVINSVWMISEDTSGKMRLYLDARHQEINYCTYMYEKNKCDLELRVPLAENQCEEWFACKKKDPYSIGKARVAAETLAEVVNGFIEQISLKTMLFFMVMFLGTVYVTNSALGSYRQSRVQELIEYLNSRNRSTQDRLAGGAADDQSADRRNNALTY